MLLPEKTFTFVIENPQVQVIARLYGLCRASSGGQHESEYIGTVTGSAFSIKEKQTVSLYNNSFVPVFSGSIAEDGSNTRIHIRATLSRSVHIIIHVFHILLFLFATIACLMTGFQNLLPLLPAGILFAFSVCMTYIGFGLTCNRSVGALKAALSEELIH